jgi:hypothetical protein
VGYRLRADELDGAQASVAIQIRESRFLPPVLIAVYASQYVTSSKTEVVVEWWSHGGAST